MSYEQLEQESRGSKVQQWVSFLDIWPFENKTQKSTIFLVMLEV